MAGDAKKVIDFGDYVGGEEALQIAARSLRSLKKDVTDLSKTVADDSGRIKAGFETIKAGIADIQSKAGKLNLFSGEDKAVLVALAQQLGELKKRQEDYKATQAAQATIQRGLTETAKQYTSELAKQKDALRAAALAQDVEGQRKAAAAIRQTTQETAQLSKALRGANSELTAAKGSYDGLVIENNKLLASLHALEGGLNSGSQEALKLKKQIYDNTQTLKDFDEATNRNFRNVGNYAQSFSGLIAELAKARAAQASFSEGSADAARNQMRIAGFQTAAQKAAANMGLSFEQAEAKIEGVTGAIQPLVANLVRLEREQQQVAKTAGEESKEFQVLGFQIQKTKKDIDEVAAAQTKAADSTGGLTEQLGFSKEGLEQFALGLAAGAIGLQAILGGVQSVFQANVEYSRNLAEVRKTTGLTADEAERLAQSLKALDTPTSLAGLLKIASVGGQLGIAKGDLLDFTKAIDTAVQALGNDFEGGAEEIATTLGKISSVFGKELGNDAAQNILAIGSAVNQLGAEGAATAPFLTDVALRVGAVATQSGLGLKDVLAYAAVLQETGFSAETSGTALNRFFSVLSTRTKEAFEIAKNANPALTLKDFTKLVNTDFNGAIQAFLKGLRAGGQTTTALSKELATLKLQSGEAKNAIITLSQQTDLFAERQKTANDQLRDATSLAAEAAVNTDTLGSSVDKLKNNASELVTGGALGGLLKGLVDFLAFDFNLLTAGLKGVGDGFAYVGEKLGLVKAKEPLQDYAAAITATALAAKKQADAQQQLLDSYNKLAGQATRTGAEEKQLSDLRARLGTADVVAAQQQIDERRKQFEGIKDQFHRDIDGLNQDIDATNTRVALSQDALFLQSQKLSAEQLAQVKEIAKARLEATQPIVGKSANPALEGAISAAMRLQKATADLAEKERNRANLLAGLAKLEGNNRQASKDAAEAAEEAENNRDRSAEDAAKRRVKRLKNELEDNQRAIDEAKKYQTEQGKLFADKQITSELFAESVAGSQDLITQYERNGTALRIKIVKAESTQKLAAIEEAAKRESRKKNITEAELTEIQRHAASERKDVVDDEVRAIEKIKREAGERQGAVEPLEFKIAAVDFEKLKRDLLGYVKTYESELTGIRDAENAREKDLVGQLSRREITQAQYDKRSSQNRVKAANEAVALDKRYNKATLDAQRDANEKILAEQNRLAAARIAAIERVGSFVSQAEASIFQIKTNSIDAQLQQSQAAYDQEIQAAGENSELKKSIQAKFDKEQKRLNFERAKADRDSALFSLAINTAVAVSKEIAQYGFLGAIPFVAADLVLSGLQLAAILSKPLPAYFKGRKGGPKELAIVGDRGPEIIHEKRTNRYVYEAKPVVRQLGAGDDVFTAHETSEMLARVGLRHAEAEQPMRVAQAFSGAAEKAREGREAASVSASESKIIALLEANVAALKKFKPTTVNVHRGSDADVEISNQLTKYRAQRLGGNKAF